MNLYPYLPFSMINKFDFDIEDCILIKATIVEHREFKNDPYTYLNRVTVLDNKGSVTELAGVIRE